ncbi:UDP-N-acetylmuramate--L-alanine ligase [Wolbachia endosymbiont of Atemnus politus]|uniref:UDP-N-acetylmuramate--L-alanine ligase n=1 Tax=Wolbachia endosymbiont of Atemnus politus TaxID=2682840 RepID=UPI00157278D6|nr:UDP-N-acetylmuramate--L-alanine ligase [Wolbachia endosymbiont of Atemnus politus]NSM56361.1 UDP-N-acetylmuramate--L-alanine ligase [Wolbachia endosymbiont of Atemnus politus]NSX83415.1 UDP-N-acetylmuramate--L-alanine ligase [Wolbachia endosymbiont of Atemnus politus]
MRILNYTIIDLVISKLLLLNMNSIQKETIHIIGIGGIGMSAIAEILHNSNYKVQGSDAQSNNNLDRLQKLGVEVYIGHNANNIRQAQVVVYSSAIKPDNVELVAARDNNITILHRSDILAEIMKDKYVIAVSGSSGKTTTTAMIASIFDHSSIDATVIVGGILNSYQSNSKLGKSDIFLAEADESDGTMLKIPANIAVITSINNDHIDHYGTFDDIKNAFSQFINRANFAILPDSVSINHDASNSITFGLEIRASNIKQHNNSIEFDVLIDSCNVGENSWIPVSSTGMTKKELLSSSYHLSPLSSQCSTRVIKNIVLSNAIGMHKVSNAMAAISVAIKLGISDEDIRKGLLEFKGVAKRFSLIADIKSVKLIEDYAHHPNEIYATLTAARSITKGKVIGIIEPLRFARIRNFFDEFIRIFMMFDYVILTPVHPPEDKPIPGCRIDDIQKTLVSAGFNNVKTMNDALLISHFISDSTNSGDVVLFIGAGSNIAKLARETVVQMFS